MRGELTSFEIRGELVRFITLGFRGKLRLVKSRIISIELVKEQTKI